MMPCCAAASRTPSTRGQLLAIGCRDGDRDRVLKQPIRAGRQIAPERRRSLHTLLRIHIQVGSGLQISRQRAERRILALGQHAAREGIRNWDNPLVNGDPWCIEPERGIGEPGEFEGMREAAQLQRGDVAVTHLKQVIATPINAIWSQKIRQGRRAQRDACSGCARAAALALFDNRLV